MEFKITLDIKSYKKALRLWNRKNSIISIIINTFVILYGIGVIVVSQFNKTYSIDFGIILLLLGIAGLITRIVKLNKYIDLSLKQMQQSYDGDSCDYLLTFFEDYITNKNLKNGNHVSIKYSNFKRCIENNDIILLITNLKQFFFISKRSIDIIEREKIINIIMGKNIPYKRVK